MLDDKCKVCDGNEFLPLFSVTDRLYAIDKVFCVVKCKRCGSLFINPPPSWEELKHHYPRSYYEVMTPSELGNDDSLKYRIRERVLFYYYNYPFKVRSRFSFFEKLILYPLKFRFSGFGNTCIPWNGGGVVLDVGCGMGAVLNRLKKFGWKTHGIELDKYAAEYSSKSGHNVICGTFPNPGLKSNFFDAVIFREVLEHLSNPADIFNEVNRVLKPSGRLYISVPISNNLFLKLFKSRWYPLDVPRHLWIPSKRAINILCKGAGMEVRNLRHRRCGEILGGIQYLINDSKSPRVYLSEGRGSKVYRNRFLMKLISPLEYLLERFCLTGTIELEIMRVSIK